MRVVARELAVAKAFGAAPGSVAVSPDLSELEAIYAESWLKNILTEMSS